MKKILSALFPLLIIIAYAYISSGNSKPSQQTLSANKQQETIIVTATVAPLTSHSTTLYPVEKVVDGDTIEVNMNGQKRKNTTDRY